MQSLGMCFGNNEAMALKKINPCKDCPDDTTCSGICPKLEKMLPSEAPATERPVSELSIKKSEEKAGEDASYLDRIHRKKWGAYPMELENQDSAWESVFIAIPDEWTEEEEEALGRSIHKAFRYGEIKLKRRFFAFLRCQDMTSIAESANTSKQNIQQSFQRLVKKIAKIFEQERAGKEGRKKLFREERLRNSETELKALTPLKLKSMIPEWK